MSSRKTPLLVRFHRLAKMAGWLIATGRDLRSLPEGDIEARNRAITKLSTGALACLNVKLDAEHAPDFTQISHGVLVASNHISWLDIFALGAIYPSSFIAKKEISTWPILGKMGYNAGTVFIDRTSKRDVEPIKAAVAEALSEGRNVTFFPEAKTSLGEDVLPFKAALYQAAIDSNSPIQSVALRYYDHKGHRTTTPSYAGKNGLFTTLWRIVSMPEIRICLDFDALCYPQDHPEADRYVLKDISENFIREKVLSDSPIIQTTSK